MTENATAADARPVHLDDADALDAFVADADLALVEFYTEGCSLCAGMEPVLGNVTRSTDAAIGLVNPREDPPLIDRFDVRQVPLLVLFVDGEVVDRRAEGFVPADDLADWLAAYGG